MNILANRWTSRPGAEIFFREIVFFPLLHLPLLSTAIPTSYAVILGITHAKSTANSERPHGHGSKEPNSADHGGAERPTLRELELEAEATGPHALLFVRAVRGVKDAAVRYVGLCFCGWETLPHNTEDLARRKFKLHRAVPWSALGF